MARYNSLAELAVAYRMGEVTAPLMIDNDNMSVWEYDDNDPAVHDELFEMDPHDVMEQALDLIGIPHESV